jgi:putative nucleotidyltransferase with HDIG domain
MRDPRILVVDDQPDVRRLLETVLEVRGHACDAAGSIAEARDLMRRKRYDILFLDVYLGDGCGLQLAGPGAEAPLVAVITGGPDLALVVEALRRGAVDLIAKPFRVAELLGSVDGIVEEWRARERVRETERAFGRIARRRAEALARSARAEDDLHAVAAAALGEALGLKDRETEGHCRRVAENAVRLGRVLGLDAGGLADLRRGAYLHDVGKIGVSDRTLAKPGALSAEELAAVRRHPELGARLLSPLAFPERVTAVVRCHHESFDGSGYPDGLRGAAIPLAARIFAVVDTLDAMTGDRPYRRALPYAAFARELLARSGRQFDPAVVEAFLSAASATWLLPGDACLPPVVPVVPAGERDP